MGFCILITPFEEGWRQEDRTHQNVCLYMDFSSVPDIRARTLFVSANIEIDQPRSIVIFPKRVQMCMWARREIIYIIYVHAYVLWHMIALSKGCIRFVEVLEMSHVCGIERPRYFSRPQFISLFSASLLGRRLKKQWQIYLLGFALNVSYRHSGTMGPRHFYILQQERSFLLLPRIEEFHRFLLKRSRELSRWISEDHLSQVRGINFSFNSNEKREKGEKDVCFEFDF